MPAQIAEQKLLDGEHSDIPMDPSPIDLRRLEAGDEQAWAQTFRHLWPIALQVALRHRPALSHEDAEDVAIETLGVVCEKIEGLATLEELKALVIAIAQRRAVSKVRAKFALKRGGTSAGAATAPDQVAEADQALAPVSRLSDQDLGELVLLLHELLEALDPTTRRLVIEHVMEGTTFQELSQKYNLALGTVCPKVARALDKLRTSLKGSPLLMKELSAFLR